MSAARVIAIGDVHGCSAALRALLDAVAPRPEDTLVPLGDYVDRGPDGNEVVELLVQTAERCQMVPLFGNHEELMLSVVCEGASPEAWLKHGGIRTLDSYQFSGDLRVIPATHIDFLKNCRPYYETDTHLFLHANYDPDLPLEKQEPWTLRWKTLREDVPRPHRSGKVAIVGHTADVSGEIFDIGHLKCIDTFCYGGGWLTALDVTTGQLWQANRQGRLREA